MSLHSRRSVLLAPAAAELALALKGLAAEPTLASLRQPDLAAAASRSSTVLLKGLIRVNDLEIPSGVHVRGPATVLCAGSITMHDGATLEELYITRPDSAGFSPVVRTVYGAKNVKIISCSIAGGVPVWLNGVSDAAVIGNRLRSHGGYPLYSDGSEGSTIARNSMEAVAGWGLQLSGHVVNNVISDNQFVGDGLVKTGIIILSSTAGRVFGNTITRNNVRGVSEEGISVDYNVQLRPLPALSTPGALKVSDASRDVPEVLVHTREGDLILEGDSPGVAKICQISRCEFGRIPNATVISQNTVSHCGRTGIMLYGTQYGTKILNNDVSFCGGGKDPRWGGHTAYPLSGIAVLSISQAKTSARPVAIDVTHNRVSDCEMGIVFGTAVWDGPPLPIPANLNISGNEFSRVAYPQQVWPS